MAQIPIYLKTSEDMERPQDPEYYLQTSDGLFFCRNHPFFTSDVRAERFPSWLSKHAPAARVQFPKLDRESLERIVGFFGRVFELHRSESIVFLFWDLDRKRYEILVPEQEATVWESSTGWRSPDDIRYELPTALPPRHLLVGDLHCHGDHSAYASAVDCRDERYRDGLHGVVGRIEKEPPSFHLDFSIDGTRFGLEFEHVFEGYEQRRADFPSEWLERLTVKVDRPRVWSGWGRDGSRGFGSSSDLGGSSDERTWKKP